MLTRKTQVYDLANDSWRTFINDLPAIENLITAYILQKKMWSKLHDTELRKRFESLIIDGDKTLAIGDLCVMKEVEQ